MLIGLVKSFVAPALRLMSSIDRAPKAYSHQKWLAPVKVRSDSKKGYQRSGLLVARDSLEIAAEIGLCHRIGPPDGKASAVQIQLYFRK
jgi:hypothetical protein